MDDPGAIGAVIDSLAAHDSLAFDLEADSFYRYWEKVCLIQLSTPDEDFLIDVLSVGMPEPLHALLEDRSRTWVLHGADFDVLSLKRDYGLVFGNLFDTMIAARFLGEPSVGLAAMLKAELDVEVSKSEQRSDWRLAHLHGDGRGCCGRYG